MMMVRSSYNDKKELIYIRQDHYISACEFGMSFRVDHYRPGSYYHAWAWVQLNSNGGDLQELPYNWTYG